MSNIPQSGDSNDRVDIQSVLAVVGSNTALIDLTVEFSSAAFAALLTTLDAHQTVSIFEPEFCQPWKHRQDIYRRLHRLSEEGTDVSVPGRSLVEALEDDGMRGAVWRGAADLALRHTVSLLPQDERLARAMCYLDHRRISRRESGRRILRGAGTPEAASELLHRGLRDQDAGLIVMALRLGAVPPDVDVALSIIGDGAAASRLIEHHIEATEVAEYAQQFPSAVLRFIGRTKCDELAPLAISMTEHMLAEPFSYTFFRGYEQEQMIGLGFWVLGQLGLRDAIIRLEVAEADRRRAATPNALRSA